MPSTTSILRRAFVDVCNGYSVGVLKGQRIYIRHLSHRAHVGYEDVQAGFEELARKTGAQTEAQRLAYLNKEGSWTEASEIELARQKDYLVRLEEGRKNVTLPSVLRSHEEQMVREREKLKQMQLKRAQLIGETVETYAARRLEDYYLFNNLFTDATLTTPLYTEETFDALEEEEVVAVQDLYKATTEPCSDANLRRLSVQDFFLSYYNVCGDNATYLFGKPACELTYYQIHLFGITRYMKSLMENLNMHSLSPTDRADPDALEKAYITQKNAANVQMQGAVPVGATSQDLKDLGLQGQLTPVPPAGLSGVELVKWLQKNNRAAPR